MALNDFDSIYLSKLVDIISKENKTVFLLGHFNIDILKYEKRYLKNELHEIDSPQIWL